MRNWLAWLSLFAFINAAASEQISAQPEKPFIVSHIRSIECLESDSTTFFSPLGLSFSPEGKLALVDGDNSCVRILDADLTEMRLLTSCPSTLGSCRLVDVEITLSTIYVSDALSGSVLCFDRKGMFIDRIAVGEGVAGIDIGEDDQLYGVVSLDGIVRTLHTGSGEAPFTINLSGDTQAYPLDCVVTASGRIFVGEANAGRVEMLGSFGRHIGYLTGFDLSSPYGLAEYRDRYIMVCDSQQGLVAVFTDDGEFVQTFGQAILVSPTFVACRDDGIICVSDSKTMSIEVFKIDESSD